MTAETWRVEERVSQNQPWSMYVDRLSREIAGETAAVIQGLYPGRRFRLVDDATGEVVHLGHDGKPLLIDVTRLDRRKPEQIEADRLADRYEASLERERDL